MATADPPSDQDLLNGTARGDADAFAALYDRHGAAVYRMALRTAGQAQDAADATQEAFLHVFDRAGSLRLSGRLSSYLYPVVTRIARRLREKAGRHTSDEEALAAALRGLAAPERSPGFPPDLHRGEGLGDLGSLVLQLPEAQREAVLLRFVDGLSVREAAEVLGVPEGTVKSRVHKGLGALREARGHSCEE